MAQKAAAGGGKVKKKRTSQKYKNYESSGKAKNKTCPKCGSGVLMANHKDRTTCGKCGYTEFNKK